MSVYEYLSIGYGVTVQLHNSSEVFCILKSTTSRVFPLMDLSDVTTDVDSLVWYIKHLGNGAELPCKKLQ